MFLISAILGTYADTRNIAAFELCMRHNFVVLNGHVPIYCFLGISLVPKYTFSDEVEHLSRIYDVARFNLQQQKMPRPRDPASSGYAPVTGRSITPLPNSYTPIKVSLKVWTIPSLFRQKTIFEQCKNLGSLWNVG